MRKMTICLDGWTKRGLTASFMGVSACFYHPPAQPSPNGAPTHSEQWTPRPCITETLERWDIGEEKVLLIVIDTRSVVKAAQLLRQRSQVPRQESTDELQVQPEHGLGELWVKSDTDETDEEVEKNGEKGET